MKIHGIFPSLNGEICREYQGSLTVFLRTYDCPLRCRFCDSKFSYEGPFIEMTPKEIVDKILEYKIPNVTITGGEPLFQDSIYEVIQKLVTANKLVSIETNGSMYIPTMSSSKVSWVADYKLPSSGMEDRMNLDNYENLTDTDFIKFVITDAVDFDRAQSVIDELQGATSGDPKFVFSPAFGEGLQTTLAEWMLNNKMLCRIGAIYSLQIHKILSVP